jgi:hypothetical protein
MRRMRTVIDLPTDLMQAAKVKAAERGESLKDLVTRAIAHETGAPSRSRKAGEVHRREGRCAQGPLICRGASLALLAIKIIPQISCRKANRPSFMFLRP